ncbi:MAG TPA: hypothetical protein VJG13_05375, partial [Thermoanaerobaculia bacterium]|nr:hypothetical protein [Thermoanaerobaculia bacterium]
PPRPRPATAPPRPARAAWAGAGGAGARLGAQLGAKLGAAARSGLGAAAGAVRAALRGLGRALARARLPAGAMPPLPRLALVAAVAAASAALLGGLLLFAASRGAAEPAAEPPAEHRQRLAAVPLLRAAHLRLEEGDPLAALAYLRQAERAAPDLPEVRARRRQVEEQARSLDRLEERVDQVAEGLEEARIAAEQERWEEAGRAARAVLAVEPENREAREITGRAGSALARIARRRAAQTPSPAAAAAPGEDGESAAAAPEPAGPAAPEAADERAAPTGRSRLELYFYSAVPEGVLTVYVGQEQLLRESFRFYRKESFFRVVPAAGEIENSYTVASGEATIRVLVALPGRPALSRVLEGELPDAGGRRLTVRLSEDRTLTARLE